jgi:hypothetical protein
VAFGLRQWGGVAGRAFLILVARAHAWPVGADGANGSGEDELTIKSSFLLMAVGAFLTFAFIRSTSVFDPQAFGVALMIAGALSAGTDLVHFTPRRRWAVAFDNPDTVLPPRGHAS